MCVCICVCARVEQFRIVSAQDYCFQEYISMRESNGSARFVSSLLFFFLYACYFYILYRTNHPIDGSATSIIKVVVVFHRVPYKFAAS